MIRGLELHDAWKQPRSTYIHIQLPLWSHETRPFLNNLGNTTKTGNRNYACRLHGPLRCRDAHYYTRRRLAESTTQMEDGPHTDKR